MLLLFFSKHMSCILSELFQAMSMSTVHAPVIVQYTELLSERAFQ